MKLEFAMKKLKRLGYNVEREGDSVRYRHYLATKTDKHIRFTSDETTISDICIYRRGTTSRCVGNLTIALQENGDIARKAPKIENQEQLRKRLLVRWSKFLTLTDEEIISLNLYTESQIRNAMGTVFPMMDAYVRRETYKGRRIRERLRTRADDLWDRTKDAYVKKYSSQAPLRRIVVVAPVEPQEGYKPDYPYRDDNSVYGSMAVFAWDPSEAQNTVRMMLGELATVRDCGIVAVGPKDQALESFQRDSSASTLVKNDMARIECDIVEIQAKLKNAHAALEYAQKRMKVAAFIDGVSNMASMLNNAN
jgi:hypothetical protein